MSDHEHERDHHDPQVAQDIDAARQMSRARAGSIDHRPGSMTSPRLIPGSQGRRPSMRQSDDPTAPPTAHSPRDSPSAMRAQAGSYIGSRSPVTSRGSASASAAQRFYMQSRRQHGSNTSVDSASHFIDHRAQPHSMSTSSQHPAPIARHASRLGRSEEHGVEEAVQDETMDANVDELAPRRGTTGERSSGGDHAHTPHTMSRRPSALEDDVCFPLDARTSPQQLPHYPSEYPDDSRAYEEAHHDHAAHHHHPGNLPCGFPWTFDMQALEEYANDEREQLGFQDVASSSAAANGMRNRSKSGRGVSLGVGNGGGGDASGAAYGISPDSDDATFYSRRPRKHNASANAPSAPDRPPVEESQKQGRYQRKLALFETGGSAPPPQNIFGSRADAKTPLLGGGDSEHAATSTALPSYNGTGGAGEPDGPGKLNRSYSQPNNPFPGRRAKKSTKAPSAYSLGAPAMGIPAPADKPYRFTFYSNALPSTIHARHLAELPAKGQSFSELFAGLEPGAMGGSGGNEEDEGEQRTSPGGSTAAEGHHDAGKNGGSGAAAKPDPAQPGASALTAQLAARGNAALGAMPGRKEGTTAPPSRAQTPVAGGPSNRSSANLAVTRTSTINAGANPATAASNGRTVPGGGIRMDQDPEANTWWLDVLSPTDSEMKLLSRVFGIHPLTTEDILMEETREKIELFRNYYLVCFRSFDQDPYSPTYLEPLNMYIIVFREGTLSFHFRATPHPQNVRRRIKQLKDYINVTSDWISYALIDDITDAFGPLIQSIEYEVDSIDELVLILKDVEQSDMLRRIGACRKKVMGLLRLMGNKADVVKGLAKRCNENWSVAPKSDIGLYLSDIQDHLITMTQNLSHFEKILSRSHSNYLAQISIEMTEANNRANDVLSKLTALGTVIVPLNVITGLWGMNVNVPGQGVENLHWFGGLVAFMVSIAVAGYWVAIRYLSAD
ncbi:cora-domain-containing protein [Jaminaea rosea]|uniref:Cora-domain-containing protein n=1 Tax=Jaminaea rosea TaxID=1569628 RepID=A0A316UGW8_9BASI|nr:cora-domain-containing protein [Jaminaea rosea]PWN24440.1 cora-domain-containing protein [Jaminaea rosea]